jgi:hypothetical protein
MTRQENGTSPCHQGHGQVLHTRLNGVGMYVLFPSMCFHRGYYSNENTEVMTTFLTAQLFASFGTKRISRKTWNARTDFYEGKQIVPELLHDLTLDLQVSWDNHYSATRFPPSRMYKNAKIDTQSNRVIHRIDFDRFRHVRTLVDTFETLYPELQMETVWFIKKSLCGDGFQRWHQDLNGNGTVVATIVVTLDTQSMNQQCLVWCTPMCWDKMLPAPAPPLVFFVPKATYDDPVTSREESHNTHQPAKPAKTPRPW